MPPQHHSTFPRYFYFLPLAQYLSYPIRQDFRMWDLVSFVVIVLCKTTQYVLANLLVLLVVMLAMSKR